MNAIHSILTGLADVLLLPFRGVPPQIPLLCYAVVVGVIMAWVFRHTSNQKALRRAAGRARAELFAMKLFKEGFGVMVRAQGRLLKATGARLWYSVPPMLVLMVPLVLILIQLALRYEHRALVPGDPAVVELHLRPSSWDAGQHVSLTVPPHVAVETPALRDEAEHTVYWRIRPRTASPATLQWQFDDELVEKTLAVTESTGQLCVVSQRRPGSGWLDRVLYPAEDGLASASPVRSILVHHPRRSTPILGMNMPWWVTFFIVSIIAALLTKPWLKVQF